MYVIMTDCEYRMSLPAVRDLAGAGFRVVCVTTKGIDAAIGGASRYAEKTIIIDPDELFDSVAKINLDKPADAAAQEDVLRQQLYVDHLDSICKQFIIDGELPVVFPVGKFTLYALSRFPLRYGHYLVSTPEVLDRANDKASVLTLAETLDIPVPKSYTWDQKEPLDAVSSRISYPCVVKYRDGEALGLKADKRYGIARSAANFIRLYTGMHARQAEPLVQQYIEGDGFGFSCIFDGNQVIDYICHRRIREYPITGGPSTCCEAVDIPVLKEASQKLLTALGFKGIAMVEFKGGPETGYYLMEINPRIWGSFALTRCARSRFSERYVTHCRGLIPMQSLAQASATTSCGAPPTDLRNDAPPSYRIGAKMIYRTNDAAAGLSCLKAGKAGKAVGALLDIVNPFVRDGMIELSDLKPFIVYMKNRF